MTHILLVGATSHLAPSLYTPLLSSPFTTSLVFLSRSSIRSAPILAHPKVTQILHPDFSSFPEELFLRLRDEFKINAVIWCVGGWISRFKTWEDAYDANVGAALRFLEGCLEWGVVRTPAGMGGGEEVGGGGREGEREASGEGEGEGEGEGKGKGRRARYIDPESQRRPLRFVYFSTYNAVQDQFQSLWTDAKFRKLKGAGEKALLELADEKGQGMCEVYCLRIGRVLSGGQSVANVLKMGMGGYISDELVGRKVTSLCLGGRGDEKYGEVTGGGVLELEEVMGEGWADFNSVTVGY